MSGPLLFDGAKGTELLEYCNSGELPAELNLRDEERVRKMHEEYLKAGSEVILTNTCGIDLLWMKGPEELSENIVKTACRIASESIMNFQRLSGKSTYVAALVSAPFFYPEISWDMSHSNIKSTSHPQLLSHYRCVKAQLDIFTNKTPDSIFPETNLLKFIVIENIASVDAFSLIIQAILEKIESDKNSSSFPHIIFSFTTRDTGALFDGKPISDALYLLDCILSERTGDFPEYSIGLNCGASRTSLERAICSRVSYFSPSDSYSCPSPDVWARYVKNIIERYDIKMAGGCCNTTPVHIRCLKNLLS